MMPFQIPLKSPLLNLSFRFILPHLNVTRGTNLVILEAYPYNRWSAMPKTPKLGDMNTPWGAVNAFYNAWFHFKTWRDFSYFDEYDPEDAGSRDERRWMERRNAKERSKRDRTEAARIYSLVQGAYNVDPRVIAFKKVLLQSLSIRICSNFFRRKKKRDNF